MKFISLRWKISGILVFSNIFLGVIIIFIIHRSVTTSLENELIERGRAIALNMSLYTGELILEEDKVGLTKIVTSLLSFETEQYILIQNSEGEYISDTYNGNIPPELTARSVNEEINNYSPQLITLTESGEKCYDILVPVEEGSLGYIRIGMKQSYIYDKVWATNKYII